MSGADAVAVLIGAALTQAFLGGTVLAIGTRRNGSSRAAHLGAVAVVWVVAALMMSAARDDEVATLAAFAAYLVSTAAVLRRQWRAQLAPSGWYRIMAVLHAPLIAVGLFGAAWEYPHARTAIIVPSTALGMLAWAAFFSIRWVWRGFRRP